MLLRLVLIAAASVVQRVAAPDDVSSSLCRRSPHHPAPQRSRSLWCSLDGVWELDRTPVDLSTPPHDTYKPLPEKIVVPFPPESNRSGVGAPPLTNYLWYRRNFTVPEGWPTTGRSAVTTPININFEGVNWETHVYVNGEHVFPTIGSWKTTLPAGDSACIPRWNTGGCSHQGGFSSFSIGWVNDASIGGAPATRGKVNTLLVGVYNPAGIPIEKDGGGWVQGRQNCSVTPSRPDNSGRTHGCSSGITDSVWLEVLDYLGNAEHRFQENNLRIRPISPASTGRVELFAPLRGDIPGHLVKIVASLDGLVVGSVIGAAEAHHVLQVDAGAVHLWSPDSPTLYNLSFTSLSPTGEVIDKMTSYFALRDVEASTGGGNAVSIVLNGKRTPLIAVTDEGWWPDSGVTSPSDDAIVTKLRIVKALGFNAIYKPNTVASERFYYHSDRLGVMVVQGFPCFSGANGPATSRQRLRNFRPIITAELIWVLLQKGNHPSIVAWSLFQDGCVLSRDDNDTNGAEIDAMQQILRRQICR